MISQRLNILLLLVFTISFCELLAHGYQSEHSDKGIIQFVRNKGQWSENVLYEAGLFGGKVFLEEHSLTYLFYNTEDVQKVHGWVEGQGQPLIRAHAYKVRFLNASDRVSMKPAALYSHFRNYFLGNDPSRWATNVPVAGKVNYTNIYPGIDLSMYAGEGDNLKYDLIVAPGGDPSSIQLKYEGVDNLFLRNGKLYIQTSVNQVIEQKPYAYQVLNGIEQQVVCNYHLSDSVLTFVFPEGFDKNAELIIDPELVFVTYTGSTGDNWGTTATYDDQGNAYAGGTIFEPGYPVSIGAFQLGFAGGYSNNTYENFSLPADIGITKYSADGQTILYSTYLGGKSNETPHSLIVNSKNELVLIGTTSSNDFPVTANAYDKTFAGGSFKAVNGIGFNNGSDLIVAKLDSMGSNLTASTYVGGSSNDGLNLSGSLQYNYGDQFRGEVMIDGSDNIYVASTTASKDFPVKNAIQPVYGGGGQDAIVFKFSDDLTSLFWSTYLGGSDDDAAYSVQLDGKGDIYVGGGTKSSNFPTTGGVVNSNHQGGVDGFITKIQSTGSVMLKSTFLGTGEYDQVYFVQLDTLFNVYALGQTEGKYPVSQGVYKNDNSGQFIQKFDNDLSKSIYSTVFGTGKGWPDISPSAFLVNVCDNIYVSGWGGKTNDPPHGKKTLSTTGLPVTSNAYQRNTDGSDFYLMVLSADAKDLLYATFMGHTAQEHVDGGTSRFDKNGVVYQSVCGGCGGIRGFPGVVRDNASANCNNLLFKFDLTKLEARIDVESQTPACAPALIQFNNKSVGGVSYFWDFGDGTTSDKFESSHTYTEPGIYHVMLVTQDPTTCRFTDTARTKVSIDPVPDVGFKAQINCGETEVTFTDTSFISGGSIADYNWNFGDNTASGEKDPVHQYPGAGIYKISLLVTSDKGCQKIATGEVEVYPKEIADYVNTIGCFGVPTEFTDITDVGSGKIVVWEWDFGDGDTAMSQHTVHTYADTGSFNAKLVITTSNGCKDTISKPVTVFPNPDANFLKEDICIYDSASFVDISTVTNDEIDQWKWALGNKLFSGEPNPKVKYFTPGRYPVSLKVTTANGCTDTVMKYITVFPEPVADFSNSDPCIGNSTVFYDSSSVSTGSITNWNWQFGDGLGESAFQHPKYVFDTTGTYSVRLIAKTDFGCVDTVIKPVTVHPLPVVSFSPYAEGCRPLEVQFKDSSYVGGGDSLVSWNWSLGDGNTSTEQHPLHLYLDRGKFDVGLTVISSAGCASSKAITEMIFVYDGPGAAFDFDPRETSVFDAVINFQDKSAHAEKWLWYFGDGDSTDIQHPSHEYKDWGYYDIELVVEDKLGCRDTALGKVYIKPEFRLYVPNVFTPNEDGDNDDFISKGIGIVSHDMWVFDRWGEMIYHTGDEQKPWDGKVQGSNIVAKEDVYVYMIEVVDAMEKRHKFVGHVNLVR